MAQGYSTGRSFVDFTLAALRPDVYGCAQRAMPSKSFFLLLLLVFFLGAAHAATPAGGVVSQNTVWSGAVVVNANVTVPSGVTLTIQAGATVSLPGSISISASAGGMIDVRGTASDPVLFSPSTPGGKWGNIAASGANSSVTVRFAELNGGGVNLGSGATGLIEDSYIHDVYSAIVGNSAKFVTMRRNHVKNFSETIFNSGTVILAEDSLYENMTASDSDALEIQGGPPGSIVRRCTFRHSTGSNSDAVDFNGTSGVFIHDCLIYDFTDKGISMGASGAGGAPDNGMTISNCLIYATAIGIAVKDGSTCGIYQTTIAGCPTGCRLYQKFATPVAGGHITNSWNNIIWNTSKALDLANNSSVAADYSDFQAATWPGNGNVSADPQFLNAALRDYRLSPSSPLRGTGFGGLDFGAHYPVGAPMASSHPALIASRAGSFMSVGFWVDPDRTYTLSQTTALGKAPWAPLTNSISSSLPAFKKVSISSDGDARFFELVSSGPR